MISLGSTRWTSSNPAITLSFAYEKQRSGADMQYRTQITVSTITGSKYFGYPIYLKLTMGGELKETKTVKNASPSRWSTAITYTSPWYTVADKTSGTVPVFFNVYSGQGSSRSATYAYNLDVDPATSVISATNGTLGTALTLGITRYNTSFTDTITYKCGTVSGTVKSGSTATSVVWNTGNGNVVALAAQNTSGPTVDVTFTVTTYSGSTPVGSIDTTVKMAIPDTVKPSVKLSIEDTAGYDAIYGAYVQGYSKPKITATPTLAYGSPIKTYSITSDGISYHAPYVIVALRNRGSLEVTAQVTDNRGHTSEPVTENITVLGYAKPVVNLAAYRCDANGNEDPEGAYMKIVVTSAISSLNGKNSATYKIEYPGGTLTGSGTTFASNPLPCDVSTTHQIDVTVTDKLSNTPATAVIPIAYTLTDYYHTGKGISFGKVGTRDGFDCAMPAYFTGSVTVNDKSLLDLIYPVGSIYMSANNTSPQSFFGGTWERIQDRFLLAAGSTYAAGSTGGSATHTLTVNELASHYHDGISTESLQGSYRMVFTNQAPVDNGAAAYWDLMSGTTPTDLTARTVNAGGNEAHNNMPPYLTVYMWKRTA